MKAFRVSYTVKQEYVETNKKNIKQVMSDLRELNNPGIKYASFQEDDGRTFMHFAMYPDEETAQIIPELPSFKKFVSELKASCPEILPKTSTLTVFDSAYDFFG